MSPYISPTKRKAAVALLLLLSTEKVEDSPPKRQRIWTKAWLQDRDVLSHDNLLRELRLSAPDDYKNYLRMPEDAFNHLLSLITPCIKKQDTCMRRAITPEQRLTATLRYLATGRALQDLKFTTGISAQALGHIIPETCAAIIQCLQNDYMKFPSTTEEWLKISEGFAKTWNFPNCGGAIDGKHIRITAPPNTGSYYFNYKGFFSIVLLAVVNSQYEFLYVDIGKNGRVSDGGVIEQCTFYHKLRNNLLNVPTNSQTFGGMNFSFVADDAFALHEHVLKPYPLKNINYERKIFNYRLARARRVVENAFGILANRFRVLHTAISLRLDKIDIVVYACCVLHNYLRRQHGGTYLPTQAVDYEDLQTGEIVPGEWRSYPAVLTNLQICVPRNITCNAKQNREKYLHYFNGVGAVEWQNRKIV
ncbi:putative nuclease HARBI1 [Hyperolius riggenbachi]|uniref:putative nuclease HARBI1 n=1 Tax=Hyperolius riggenbachi TaxID=752182 RepID=UPI0035A38695